MTTADVIMGYLERAGIRRIYGTPGQGSCLDIIEAARTRSIEFVGAQQASAAAIMAATDADLTGRPGVCVTAEGASASAAVAGVAHAHLCRLPLLLFSGCPSRSPATGDTQIHIDNSHIFQYVTKESLAITPTRAERVVAKAWETATALPPGPVHLELPADHARGTAKSHTLTPRASQASGPSPSAIRTIGRILTQAGRAVVVCGLGCRGAAAAPLLDLVEHLGAPTFTTMRAKGVIPDDHPLSAGVFTGGRTDNEILGRANSLLLVGVDPVEVSPCTARGGLTTLAMAEYRSIPHPLEPEAEAVGALPVGLDLLRANLPPAGEWNAAAWARRGEAFRNKTRALLADACRARGGVGLAPHRVVEIAREVFPRDTMATVDEGACAFAAAAFWEGYAPKAFLCSPGGGAAHALPAGIAAKLVFPERPVVAFMGDAGFLANLPEIATAALYNVAVTAVVFCDDARSLTRVAQEQKRYAPIGTSLGQLDVPKLADGLGALGATVDNEDDLRSALVEAVKTAQPTIVAVRVNPHGYRQMLDIQRKRWGR